MESDELCTNFIEVVNHCISEAGNHSFIESLYSRRLRKDVQIAIELAAEQTIELYMRQCALPKPCVRFSVHVSQDTVSIQGKASYGKGIFRKQGRKRIALRLEIPKMPTTSEFSQNLMKELQSQLG